MTTATASAEEYWAETAPLRQIIRAGLERLEGAPNGALDPDEVDLVRAALDLWPEGALWWNRRRDRLDAVEARMMAARR